MKRRMMVSSALPYANGPIHIGHLLEYVHVDTWVRFMRMAGHEVHFVCADDAHGTAITLEAEKLNETPENLIDRLRKEHLEDMKGFYIEFDNYYTTHSEENRLLSEKIFASLQEAGLIATRDVEQLYDPKRKQFLADRYIRGECPKCGAADQPGDNCEACSKAYAASDLINPRSAISGAELELRKSLHYFFELSKCANFLKEWIATKDPGPGIGPRLQKQAENKLVEWFKDGLQDWDISRDAPYFGFLIPGTKDKYFYVWLDAPIGYMASFKNLCDSKRINFDDFWNADSKAEVYHFIGKDIMNFHGLFWPAILQAAGYRTPTRLYIHGFLTVNGTKMSKSKGTFITASSYRELKLDPDWFRYYMCCKLNDKIEDLDLSMDDFVQRVNSDLVGKLANIPSRVAKVLNKNFDNKLCADAQVWTDFDFDHLAACYETRKFSEICRLVMAQAEEVNRAIENAKPWKLVKDETKQAELHKVCTSAIESFKVLLGCLKPMIPGFTKLAEEYLNCGELSWDDLKTQLPEGHQVGTFRHLMNRLDAKKLVQLQEANRTSDAQVAEEKTSPTIDIDDFSKVELRVAQVLEARDVDGSDKLLKLKVSLGKDGERTILAGMKNEIEVDKLVGKKIVVCANLKPRKMRFGTSEGMALAAQGDDSKLHVLILDDDTPVGASIS